MHLDSMWLLSELSLELDQHCRSEISLGEPLHVVFVEAPSILCYEAACANGRATKRCTRVTRAADALHSGALKRCTCVTRAADAGATHIFALPLNFLKQTPCTHAPKH